MAQIDRTEGLVGNTAIKAPCAVATTANITLSGEQTIDGVTTSEDRVLVKNQTDTTENGIYVSDSGSWERADDFDGTYDVVEGTLVKVNGGTAGAGFWYVSTTGSPVPGTDAISFSKASTVLATVSTFAQTILDDTTAAAVRTTIGAQQTITGAATTIDTEDLTASRALVSNASGKVAVSSVTSTELGYVANVTSAIQTQLNLNASGSYTPGAVSNTTNIAAVTVYGSRYLKVNDQIVVCGRVNIDPTISGAFSFDYGIPVASAFTNVAQLAGTANGVDTLSPCTMRANTATAKAQFVGTKTNGDAEDFYFIFAYRVI